VLETNAAMQAARSCADDDLTSLEDALRVCRASAGKAKVFRDADLEFHSRLVGIQKNSVLTALHGALIEWGLYHPEKGIDVDKIHKRVIGQHEAIVIAIREKNPTKASDAMHTHLMDRKNAK
jgi:GntR family transcriptional repressor for pyruvate dehydrogenase complex